MLPIQWEALDYMSTFAYQAVTQQYEKVVEGNVVMSVKLTKHKDTFDRMLIAHALTAKLGIVSPDSLFPFYEPLGLNVIWK